MVDSDDFLAPAGESGESVEPAAPAKPVNTGSPASLDDLGYVVKLLEANPPLYTGATKKAMAAEALFCSRCGDQRRMEVRVVHVPIWPKLSPGNQSRAPQGARKYVPALLWYHCVQCRALFTAVIYQGPRGPSLAVLPSSFAGVATPNTPKSVAYYLDQAHRAHSVGANTAAVAMYRAGLEQLLFDQGFKTGMLHAKVTALEAAITAGDAPKWAVDLDTELLRAMKDLGNGAIHPNDGDITKQDILDAELVHEVTNLFHALLFIIYEAPTKTASRIAALKARAAVTK